MEHYEEIHGREHDSALAVNKGIEQPPIVNPHFRKVRRQRMTTDQYMEGIRSGNITVLSQAITLVESLLPEHYAQAQEIIERCLPYSGGSVRIGITGVPGAGKSTFIEAIGDMVTHCRQWFYQNRLVCRTERRSYQATWNERDQPFLPVGRRNPTEADSFPSASTAGREIQCSLLLRSRLYTRESSHPPAGNSRQFTCCRKYQSLLGYAGCRSWTMRS